MPRRKHSTEKYLKCMKYITKCTRRRMTKANIIVLVKTKKKDVFWRWRKKKFSRLPHQDECLLGNSFHQYYMGQAGMGRFLGNFWWENVSACLQYFFFFFFRSCIKTSTDSDWNWNKMSNVGTHSLNKHLTVCSDGRTMVGGSA